jgi:hypothetical protein
MAKYTNKTGKLRLYDGTGTPYYLQLELDNGDFTGPTGVPTLEEMLVLNRGNYDAFGHYINGADTPVMEPVDISFSVIAHDGTDFGFLMDWVDGNTVNAHTIVTTKGTTNRANAIVTPVFADPLKKCFNVEYLQNLSIDLCYHYNEVYFDRSKLTITESADGVTIAMAGKCYGTIVRNTAFSAGTDVTV